MNEIYRDENVLCNAPYEYEEAERNGREHEIEKSSDVGKRWKT